MGRERASGSSSSCKIGSFSGAGGGGIGTSVLAREASVSTLRPVKSVSPSLAKPSLISRTRFSIDSKTCSCCSSWLSGVFAAREDS